MYALVLLFLALSQISCSTMRQSSDLPRSVRIELKGKPGSVSETRYYSNANVKSYSQQQLLRDKQEIVDFTVLTSIVAFDAQKNILSFKVKTIAKDGTVELHNLAFPEKNEEIDYQVTSLGQVLKAGAHPPHSLFFVPALPLPKDEVEIGDTWSMQHSWLSAQEGIPLSLEIIGILKGLMPCEGDKVCADIELSGHVKLAKTPSVRGSRFSSRLTGRMLFALERGDILWSEMRSEEEMLVQGERLSVLSCMVSELKLGLKYKSKLECTPQQTTVSPPPSF